MIRRFLSALRYYFQFIPLKRNGLLFVVMVSLLVFILQREYYGETSQYTPFFDVFAWLLGVFVGLIIGFGLVYTLVCWLYLVFTSRRLKVDLAIGLEDGQKGMAGLVPVKFTVSKVLMPFVGYLKVRVVFDDGKWVGPVIINRFSGWRDLLTKQGEAKLQLEQRTQYHVKGFLFSFEDYLQFFRFSYFKRHKKLFYLYPKPLEVPVNDIPPSKAREELERVRTSKRVEGDFLNYKDFESGDDVRRIVWKIFAKNKELVVRIPEVINPQASHLHFFASFENNLLRPTSRNASGMLDFYKDVIYNTCLAIEKSGRKVEFSMDQVVGDSLIVDKKDQLAYYLSNAKWRKESLVEHFPSVGNSSVVCVSSLIPADQLEELISKGSAVFFVVRVSKYLDEQNLINWSNLIIRRDKKSEISKLKWLFSNTRRKVRKNEQRISQLVESENFQGQLI